MVFTKCISANLIFHMLIIRWKIPQLLHSCLAISIMCQPWPHQFLFVLVILSSEATLTWITADRYHWGGVFVSMANAGLFPWSLALYSHRTHCLQLIPLKKYARWFGQHCKCLVTMVRQFMLELSEDSFSHEKNTSLQMLTAHVDCHPVWWVLTWIRFGNQLYTPVMSETERHEERNLTETHSFIPILICVCVCVCVWKCMGF